MFHHQLFHCCKTFNLSTWRNELSLQKQKKCTQNLKRYYVHLKKKILRRADKMVNIKKKKKSWKTWSTEEIDTLINCLKSHECLWNDNNSDYKDQNKKSLALEEVYNNARYCMNRYDYRK